MSIRRKKLASRRSVNKNADAFQKFERILEQGESGVAHVISGASDEVRLSIRQAHATVAAAEQAMSAGSLALQEARDLRKSVRRTMLDAGAGLPEGGEAAAMSAKTAMVEGLKRVSESFSKALASSPAAQTRAGSR